MLISGHATQIAYGLKFGVEKFVFCKIPIFVPFETMFRKAGTSTYEVSVFVIT